MEVIKVAIADANTLLREGLKRIFSSESDLLVIWEAADDSEVIELAERTPPDVLLLDLKLPKREALQVLTELDQKAIAAKTLILSLFPETENILNTAKAGARGYALKQNSPDSLVAAIRKIHRGEIWVDRTLSCADTFVDFAGQAARGDSERFSEEFNDEIAQALSKRELEILHLVASGLRNKEISKRLFVSLRTVKVHLNHIFNKLHVNNRTQAALLLVQGQQGRRLRRAQSSEIENRLAANMRGRR